MIQCLQGEIKQYIIKAINFAKTDSDSMRRRKPRVSWRAAKYGFLKI